MTEESGGGGGATTSSRSRLPESIGGYRVLRRLSSGGMGEVLLGEKTSPGGFAKRVAIKTVLQQHGDNPEYRTLFFDEARLAARLAHPNLTQVFDFGEDDGTLFLVMEFIHGRSIESLLSAVTKQGKRVPPEVAGHIVAEAARGLHSAHVLVDETGKALNVVHRDVSPQNIIVTYSGQAKVLDFGIARSSERKAQTQMGVVRGKPGYMAPEQCLGQPLDARTDIFQLGIVLYELLTGEGLFLRENMYASIAAAVEDPAPDVTERVPGIDAGYRDVLALALAKAPEERFSTADAMARALDQVVLRSGRPVSAATVADFLAPYDVSAPVTDPSMANRATQVQPQGRPEGHGTAVVQPGRGRDAPTKVLESPRPISNLESTDDDVDTTLANAGLSAGVDEEPVHTSAAGGESPLPGAVTPMTGGGSIRRVDMGDVAGQDTLAAVSAAGVPSRRRIAIAGGAAAGLLAAGVWLWAPWSGEDVAKTEPPTRGADTVVAASDPGIEKTAPADDADQPADVATGDAGATASAEPAEVKTAKPVDGSGTRARRSRRRRRPKPVEATPAPADRPKENAPSPDRSPEMMVVEVPKTYGFLTVRSATYANTVLDGKPFKSTPFTRQKILSGKHSLELRAPDTGRVVYKEDFVLAEGQTKVVKVR